MNELYHVVGNEVGRALLFDLVQSLGKGSGGSLIIIEVIDINDDEKWLSLKPPKERMVRLRCIIWLIKIVLR